MTASPLVAGIEAIAAGHRAAGMSAVERYRAERSSYLEWDLAMQARLQRLRVERSRRNTRPSGWRGRMRRARRVANGWNGGRAREFMETSPV